jgi:hypothetical protein
LGRRGVSTAGTFDATLQGVRNSQRQAEDLERQLDDVGTAGGSAAAKLATAAKAGAGFFALGRGLSGASAALEAFNGEASNTSRALADAGDAFSSLITADPAGFFKAVGASAARSREALDSYAKGLNDANQPQQALRAAQAASALGFDKQAKAIEKQVGLLKAADAAARALDFSLRKDNLTTLDGQTRLIRFRGPADSQGLRGGLGGAGSVGLERTLRQPVVVQTEVKLDGKTVGASTKKVNQAEARRNPRQKRGPNTSPH